MESTEEEIVKRRRSTVNTTKKKDLKDLFDESEEEQVQESEEYVSEEDYTGNLFYEIFGTGKEYMYVLEKPEEKQVEVNDKEEKKLDIENIVEYISQMAPEHEKNTIEEICKMYVEGYAVNHIFSEVNIKYYEFVKVYLMIEKYLGNQHILCETSVETEKYEFSIRVLNMIIDRLYNGGLVMKDGDKLFSICKDKNMIKGVLLDNYGNLLEKTSHSEFELKQYIRENNPKYILVSGTDNKAKSLLQAVLDFKAFYMESKFYRNLPVFEKLIRVGRLGLFPEIEFISFYKYINILKKDDIFDYTDLYLDTKVSDISDIVKLGILTVLSVIKINLNFFLQYDRKEEILFFLNLSCNRIFEKEKYENLDELKDIICDEVTYKKFITYFDIQNMNRPQFKGFPDKIIFSDLVDVSDFLKNQESCENIYKASNMIDKVIEGKVFYVSEYYVLVNILNNITCYVKTMEKYYLNQIVEVKISEINEAFLSFSGEIINSEKIIRKKIKHPLISNCNRQEAEAKLKNNEEYFIVRQSLKDGKLVLAMRLYEDIIVHIPLGEDINNLDEVVNKKVKGILKNVNNIKRHKYFFKDEGECMKYVEGEASYVKYGFHFSEKYPGRLCFMYNIKGINREYLSVEEDIKYKERRFTDLESFMEYRKRMA